MPEMLKITILVATDEDPSTVLDYAQEAAVTLSQSVGGTMDEDDITDAVSVEPYTPTEGETAPRSVGVNVEVSDERIADLLTTATEGACGYWCSVVRYENPDNETVEFKHVELPLTAKGAVICIESSDGPPEGPEWRLDRAAVERGLRLMAEKEPRHWADFVSEQDDADTADAFLQLALLGEIVYG
jgi:hypothetical protein